VQMDLDSFKFRYGIGLAEGPGDLTSLQYRITTCTLIGLTTRIAKSPRAVCCHLGRLWSCLNHEP